MTSNPMKRRIHVTEALIDAHSELLFLTESDGGAVDIFLGTTRRFTNGKETVSLSYEAAERLAIAEMHRLLDDASESWPLIRATIIHRIGLVPVHEASVLIGVATAHRDESFLACRYLIDELKKRVPIWKREKFADGSEEWVDGVTPTVE